MKQQKVKTEANLANFEIKDHQLTITNWKVLNQLSQENELSQAAKSTWRKIRFFSFISIPFQQLQKLILSGKRKKVDLVSKAPVFVVGHWRSGTTHLHYLLAKDQRFCYLSNFQSFFFSISYLAKGWLDKILAPLLPKKRPQDNMEMTMAAPQEEEQALANLSITSGVHSFFFPKNRDYFNKFNLFRGISTQEHQHWKETYTEVVEGISIAGGYNRPLLKNPNSTGRIQYLKELFPHSKFIYIHRHPYSVYLSMKHMCRVLLRTQYLQEITEAEEDRMILDNYKGVIGNYIAQRDQFDTEDLIEVSYKELTADGTRCIERIYQTLGIDGFEQLRPEIQRYLDSKKNYKRNSFKEIPPHIKALIDEEWDVAFTTWGYTKDYSQL